ncbi:uncharacterized protein B0H18DRAFT_962244 [Fomitopsis serialis]|uniref:uncharacterized protein n=1 Tax=Fomitopsis serialis TaxID=139415 RepID=UPI002008B44B|nr:uncharacterized protein B0H18DRAFT_962244 [Neoantrodia serialis]KAH9911400.1 hypothetical protein B0H18DRAFT_962244 [Neoantrodia serialis]
MDELVTQGIWEGYCMRRFTKVCIALNVPNVYQAVNDSSLSLTVKNSTINFKIDVVALFSWVNKTIPLEDSLLAVNMLWHIFHTLHNSLSLLLHSASKNKTIPVGDLLFTLKEHILDSQIFMFGNKPTSDLGRPSSGVRIRMVRIRKEMASELQCPNPDDVRCRTSNVGRPMSGVRARVSEAGQSKLGRRCVAIDYLTTGMHSHTGK